MVATNGFLVLLQIVSIYLICVHVFNEHQKDNLDVPRPLPMIYIFHSGFVLGECVLMLLTSRTETYF